MSASIKINGVEHELRPSNTDCGNIDALFLATKQARYSGETKGFLIPGVDAEALHKLESIVDGISLWINSSSGAIGVLLANVDHDEIDGHDMRSIGWLLAGLSELQYCLADAEVVITQTKLGGGHE